MMSEDLISNNRINKQLAIEALTSKTNIIKTFALSGKDVSKLSKLNDLIFSGSARSLSATLRYLISEAYLSYFPEPDGVKHEKE